MHTNKKHAMCNVLQAQQKTPLTLNKGKSKFSLRKRNQLTPNRGKLENQRKKILTYPKQGQFTNQPNKS